MSIAEDRVHRYGVHQALVTEVRDPDERGRVKVKLIGLTDEEGRPLEEWARVRLEDGPASIEIADGNGNSIRLDAGGVAVTASAKVSIVASTVAVSAGMLTVDAGMSTFSGVVKADTVIANSVISASYTPGAGNLM